MSGPQVLVDTSAWIEFFRKKAHTPTQDAVRAVTDADRAVLCDMVLLELWNGAGTGRERRLFEALEASLPIVETSGQVWSAARRIARQARSIGTTVPASDLLIFATAHVHRLDLLHRDAHFDALGKLANEDS